MFHVQFFLLLGPTWLSYTSVASISVAQELNHVICVWQILEYWLSMLNLVNTNIFSEFGTFTRNAFKVDVSLKEGTTYAPGVYDHRRNYFTTAGRLVIGSSMPCKNGTGTAFSKYDVLSTAMHEGLPGHALQCGLEAELGCSLAKASNNGYSEGYACYVETLGYLIGVTPETPLGLYQNPVYHLGHLASNLLREMRMKVGIIRLLSWIKKSVSEFTHFIVIEFVECTAKCSVLRWALNCHTVITLLYCTYSVFSLFQEFAFWYIKLLWSDCRCYSICWFAIDCGN